MITIENEELCRDCEDEDSIYAWLGTRNGVTTNSSVDLARFCYCRGCYLNIITRAHQQFYPVDFRLKHD